MLTTSSTIPVPLSSDLNRSVTHGIERGYEFLASQCCPQWGFQSLNRRTLLKSTSVKPHPREAFSSILIANLLGETEAAQRLRDDLVDIITPWFTDGYFRFFVNRDSPAADINTTALGLSLLLEYGDLSLDTAARPIDQIVENSDENGIFQLYLDDEPQAGQESELADSVANLNVLYMLAMTGRSPDGECSYKTIQQELISRSYLAGTLYYPSPDSFLFFLARLVRNFPALGLQWRVELVRAAAERLPAPARPIELAMRIFTARSLGLFCDHHIQQLLAAQDQDGSWETDLLLEDGQGQPLLASRSLTTAFCLCALEAS
jgi:hypothetical protein